MALKDTIRRQSELRQRGAALNDAINAKEAAGDDASTEREEFEAIVKLLDQATAEVKRLGKLAADDTSEPAPEAEDDAEKNYAPRITKKVNANTKFSRFIEPRRKAESYGRLWIAEYHAKQMGRRNAAEWSMQHFGDEGLAEFVARGGMSHPGMQNMTTLKAALLSTAPIIPQFWVDTPVDLLYEQSKLLPLLRRQPMPMGTATIPRHRLAGSVAYATEMSNAVVSSIGFDQINLVWHKCMGLHSASKEALAFSPLDVAGKMVFDLTRQHALFMESEILQGATGGGIVGLNTQMAAGNVLTSTVANSVVSFQTVANDIERLKLVQTQNLVNPDSLVYVMPYSVGSFIRQIRSPFGGFPVFQEFAEKGTIDGRPAIETSLLASNIGNSATSANIYAITTDHVIVGDALQFNIASTDVGSYLDGGVMVSAFSQDVVAFRSSAYFDMALEHDVAASLLTTSGWTLTNSNAMTSYVQPASNSVSLASGA